MTNIDDGPWHELEEVIGVIISGHNLNKLRYADDTALMTDLERKLKKTDRQSSKGKLPAFVLCTDVRSIRY